MGNGQQTSAADARQIDEQRNHFSGGLFIETTTGREDLDYMTVGAKLLVTF